ncbi:hypothetical protein BC830DRAFT_1108657 [Chytriomyces sp. MP71]|nr:hypothetical protein BC830DRAFT_1108657 [Chytriomyces sp. MP71]
MNRTAKNRLDSHPFKQTIVSNMREVFKRADAESHGFLTLHGLKVAWVGLLGYQPSPFELEQVMSKFDLERGELTESALFDIMGPKLAITDVDDRIRHMFVAMDLDGKGFLTLDSLRRVCTQVAPRLSSQVIAEYFAEVDTNRDGKVGYREFHNVMKAALSR